MCREGPPSSALLAAASLGGLPGSPYGRGGGSSMFNDGTDAGLSHENRVLRERLREAEAAFQLGREAHAQAIQVGGRGGSI